ncbi:MAG: hypothetical protein P4L92_20485, partial [Rudaea sp.]|nr:hypothetical protein [Rudaea sp.]
MPRRFLLSQSCTAMLRVQIFAPASPSNGCFLLTGVGETRNSVFGVRESIRAAVCLSLRSHVNRRTVYGPQPGPGRIAPVVYLHDANHRAEQREQDGTI